MPKARTWLIIILSTVGFFVVCLMVLELGCTRVSRMLGRDYEYEEDDTLSVDGSATINVNASLAALVALRGLALDPNPRVRFESEKVRTAFEAAGCTVTRVSSTPWIRDGRRFVQIRMDLRDIRQASKCGPLAWSTDTFTQDGEPIFFRQVVGMPPSADASGVKGTGQERDGNPPTGRTYRNPVAWQTPRTFRFMVQYDY